MAKKKEMDKLAKDAASAKAAGMSYGRWKAMQEPGEPLKRKVYGNPCVCAWCGKTFYYKSGHKKKYCDSICQRAASDQRNREWYAQYLREWRAKKKESGGENDG